MLIIGSIKLVTLNMNPLVADVANNRLVIVSNGLMADSAGVRYHSVGERG